MCRKLSQITPGSLPLTCLQTWLEFNFAGVLTTSTTWTLCWNHRLSQVFTPACLQTWLEFNFSVIPGVLTTLTTWTSHSRDNKYCQQQQCRSTGQRYMRTVPFNNTQTRKKLLLKTQLTIAFFTAVNYYNDNQLKRPWKKQTNMVWNLPITTHRLDLLNPLKWTSVSWDVAKMIDGNEKRNHWLAWAESACYWKQAFSQNL